MPLDIPPQLLNLLIQGGFAALFIWLLFRTQARQDVREERLLIQLDKHAETLPRIMEALQNLPAIAESVRELVREIRELVKDVEEIKQRIEEIEKGHGR